MSITGIQTQLTPPSPRRRVKRVNISGVDAYVYFVRTHEPPDYDGQYTPTYASRVRLWRACMHTPDMRCIGTLNNVHRFVREAQP